MTYSEYQIGFFKEITTTNNSVLLNAVPGSGKTWTMLESLNMVPSDKRILFLAFNKAIVEEISSKCKLPNVTVKTLHSAGLSSLMGIYKSRVNNYKYRKFLNDSLFLMTDSVNLDTPEDELITYKNTILKLVDFARVSLVTSKDEVEQIALEHNIDIDSDEAEVALKMMESKNYKEIDFADMLWIPNVKNLPVQQYDMVYEFQDMSAMSNLMLRMVKPGGRFVAAGEKD